MTSEGEGGVLTQADIDALVSTTADSAPVPAPAPAAAAPPPPAPAAVQPAPQAEGAGARVASSAPAPDPGGDRADWARRIERLEQALFGEGGLETTNRLLDAHVGILMKDVQAITARLERLLRAMSGTVGYRLREAFECQSCGSKGEVASRITCTHCQKELWWGWWPES